VALTTGTQEMALIGGHYNGFTGSTFTATVSTGFQLEMENEHR